MASSRPSKLDTELSEQPSDTRSTLAQPLAPEDIRPGDFVTLLHEIREVPSFWWPADGCLRPPQEPIRMRLTPTGEAFPMKVKLVCLPFVLVKLPHGKQHTLDVRSCRLARLGKKFAAAGWKAYKKTKPTITTI
jgi:hypothetical protein